MKILILFTSVLFSTAAFCCKPATKMARETLMTSGVLNKLRSEVRFSDYTIRSITNIKNKKMVQIQHPKTKECLELVMSPYGTGACDSFTADIVSEAKIKTERCAI